MYKVGDIIKVNVTGIENYGVFVNIDSDYNGLIHISEISDSFVRDINDYVKVGDTINCKILEIDEINYQMKMSIKNIDYQVKRRGKKVAEKGKGFTPLADNLITWIKEKIKELNK